MELSYKLIRSSRKTLAIQIDVQGNITVRAPLKLSQKKIDAFIDEKRPWIERTITSQEEKLSRKKTYSDEEIAFLREKAKAILPEKAAFFADLTGVKPAVIKVNSAKKRYGSCSAKGNINFSLFLMDKDERFIDYVVVHELAHLKHLNHSKDFYKFIERYMPDYKERIKLGKY